MPDPPFDIAIIGAGAAGLMAAIRAGQSGKRVAALDGARSLGAKILVAGGGRCNVTHDVVDESAFAGSSRHAIRKVLGRFTVPETVSFFRERGVELKREETGKLFPTTDRARTVLDALLNAAREAGVQCLHPWRVESVRRDERGLFEFVSTTGETRRAQRLILATGGRSLPKTGSDGHGYSIARSLGHTLTRRIFPGLVPLVVPEGHFIRGLSGLTLPTTVEVHGAPARKLASFTDSTLCTHFGLSGPSILDISRYLTDARSDDPAARLVVNWTATRSREELDAILLDARTHTAARALSAFVPERLARTLCLAAGVDPVTPGHALTRDQRRAIVRQACECEVPISGDRGYTYAEVTAGGVPLSELRLETMESRVCPGLHLCGEICDVDGRIGGYNFQWAWASGHVAGVGAAAENQNAKAAADRRGRTRIAETRKPER